MYEELYAPLPDAGAYLDRLGIAVPKRTDIQTLDALVRAHQMRIPFENLDSWLYHVPVSLHIDALFEKIIRRKRGGYCFELNALFTSLLQTLGYRAWGCMSRIIENGFPVPPVSHRGVLVEQNGGLHFCDVGFGGPTPPGSLPVEDGSIRFFGTETYSIRRGDGWWWTLCRLSSSGNWQDILQFYVMPQENIDFVPLNEFYSTSPHSDFTQMAYINIRTENGSRSIVGNTFSQHTPEGTRRLAIGSQEELFRILRNYFRLDALPGEAAGMSGLHA